MVAIDPITVYSLLAVLCLLAVAYVASLAFLPRSAPRADKLAFCWYAFDALTHFILEGSFVYLSTFGRSVATSENAFAELWKEYGKADARWLYADPTVVSLEILTVGFCGPLCVYLLYALAARRPERHYWQIVLCTAEIYGGWMTFCPEWITGSKYLDTSNPLFLWVYLLFFNGLWVVIPFALMVQSFGILVEGAALVEAQRGETEEKKMQ
ncbi:Emopamil-binding protein [Endogone sp. FLAS-F59071]|nr:Emopamil-binding protein [Endogone sp. FLAS-F59071]|eukprot:RUS15627.1 Emopamil-binding protein [Endogone sp. FLAS-F59071]